MTQAISWIEIFSMVGSLVSIILAGFAIWLSVKFYEMSSQNTEKLGRSSNNISSTTERLETLFDKLYSDTFSMVKDTMNDMRQHVWKSDRLPPADEKAYKQLKDELLNEFNKSLSNKVDNSKLASMREELESLAEKVVDKSRRVTQNISKANIIRTIEDLLERDEKINLMNLTDYMGVAPRDIVVDLFNLKKDGAIHWKGTGLSGDTQITLTSEHKKS